MHAKGEERRVHVQARRDPFAAPPRDATKEWNPPGPFPQLLVCFHLFHMGVDWGMQGPLDPSSPASSCPAPARVQHATFKAKFAFDDPLFHPISGCQRRGGACLLRSCVNHIPGLPSLESLPNECSIAKHSIARLCDGASRKKPAVSQQKSKIGLL